MDKQFSLVLEKVIEYEQKEFGVIIAIVSVLVAILLAVAISRYRSFNFPNKVIVTLIICALCIVMLGYIVNYISYQHKLDMDISNEQYISYTGEFTHDDYQKDSFYHNVYLVDNYGNKLLVRYPDYGNRYDTYSGNEQLPIGTFAGTIIYSKDSKIVVSWNVD